MIGASGFGTLNFSKTMTGELFINNTDAYAHGVSMGAGFISAFDTPPSLKEFQTNESRADHGKRYLIALADIRYSERDVTLSFIIQGGTPEAFRANRDWLMQELEKGRVTMRVPQLDNRTYTFIYSGKGLQYALNTARTLCKLTAKFTEENPSERPEFNE